MYDEALLPSAHEALSGSQSVLCSFIFSFHMKVQPYKEPAKRGYPALAKVAALVAVSCAVSACQQQPQVRPPGVPLPHQVILGKDKK